MEGIEREKNRRLSLTKAQRQTEVGVELISLCQSFTEDGSLSEQEVVDLRKWLDDNRASDLPAIAFLTETVLKALEDGKVTRDERLAVYKALEAVLPPDIRKDAASRRRSVESEDKSQQRELKEQEKQKQHAERERNRTLGSWNFMVAGARHEGRHSIISTHVRPDDVAYLKRDRANKFSRHAVEVRAKNGLIVGYIPEDYAQEIAPLLDEGCRHEAFFTKVLTGGQSPIPVVQAYLYGAGSSVDDSVSEADVPTGNGSAHSVLSDSERVIPLKYIAIGGLVFLVLILIF
jgi:hypothetical protein